MLEYNAFRVPETAKTLTEAAAPATLVTQAIDARTSESKASTH